MKVEDLAVVARQERVGAPEVVVGEVSVEEERRDPIMEYLHDAFSIIWFNGCNNELCHISRVL